MSRRDTLLAVLVASIWGFNFVVIDWGMGDVPPLLFAAIRFTLVAVPACALVRRPQAPWRTVVAVGVFMSLGQFGFLYASMHLGMPPGLAALVLQAQVVLTVVIAAGALRERPSRGQAAGVLIGVVGLVVVGLGRGGHVPATALLLCLAAALSWAIGNVVSRAARLTGGGLSLTVWSALVVPVPLLALSLVLDGPGAVGDGVRAFGWHAAVSTLYTAGLASLVGYAVFNTLLARNPSSAVVPWVLLAPVVAAASAWPLRGEVPNAAELTGGALLLIGVLVAQGVLGTWPLSGRRSAVAAVPAPRGAAEVTCLRTGGWTPRTGNGRRLLRDDRAPGVVGARRACGRLLLDDGSRRGVMAEAGVASAHGGVQVGPVTVVSAGCDGPSAEVVSAVGRPDDVYEAWIGCGGEGFARSTDGGLHFQDPITLPDSSNSDDPALAVAPDGTVYVSYLRYFHGHAYPVVATSYDHGATFPQVRSLIPSVRGNWGDRDFIAAGRHGTVYVTWDYGPSIADVGIVCSPTGSCAYSNVDATAVVQASTDHGKTWGPITDMQPGFPAGGGYDASVVVEPNGRIDALIWNHHIDPTTFAVDPGHEAFTSSADGGRTWSPLVDVQPDAGSIAILTWRIDGNLGIDHAGNLYAVWETQTAAHNTSWLSYPTDHGKTWSAARKVLQGRADAVEDMEVVGTKPGVADVAWQADTSPNGYSTQLRQFSIKRGWLGPAIQVSTVYGDPSVWPGDTFGLSALPGGDRHYAASRVAVSWGGAPDPRSDSQIYAATVHLPPVPAG